MSFRQIKSLGFRVEAHPQLFDLLNECGRLYQTSYPAKVQLASVACALLVQSLQSKISELKAVSQGNSEK